MLEALVIILMALWLFGIVSLAAAARTIFAPAEISRSSQDPMARYDHQVTDSDNENLKTEGEPKC